MIHKKGKANFYLRLLVRQETTCHSIGCILMDLSLQGVGTEPEVGWSEDFTCPLPAMDLSQRKGGVLATKMTKPMSMAGLILLKE